MNLRTRSARADWLLLGQATFFITFHTTIRRRSLRRHPKLTTLSGPSFYRAFRINLKKHFLNFSMCTSPGTLKQLSPKATNLRSGFENMINYRDQEGGRLAAAR